MTTPANRFVVGPDSQGRSAVVQRGLTNVQSQEGFFWRATLWATRETPVDNSIAGDRSQTPGLGPQREPFPNGFICRACAEIYLVTDTDEVLMQPRDRPRLQPRLEQSVRRAMPAHRNDDRRDPGRMTTVHIELGAVRGAEHNGVHRFLGIPYAAAPLGRRQRAAPAPPPSWHGVREATAFGNSSMPTVRRGVDPVTSESEDCLNLNVWTPEPAPGSELPVMVWIHGGGLLNASSAVPLRSGQWLAKRAVLVVSINYRLGAFGFLTHPELGVNFCVPEWVSALTWVHTNIAALWRQSRQHHRARARYLETLDHIAALARRWRDAGHLSPNSDTNPLPRPCFRSCTA